MDFGVWELPGKLVKSAGFWDSAAEILIRQLLGGLKNLL